MEKIVSLVQEKTGISESQARTAVETVISVLKKRMPEGMAKQLDAYVKGEGGGASGIAGKLGDMF